MSYNEADFDNTLKVTQRGLAKVTASGFVTAMTQFDGTSWKPESNLNGDMIRTEYRNRFNKEKPFHRMTNRFSMYTVPRKVLVYDKE